MAMVGPVAVSVKTMDGLRNYRIELAIRCGQRSLDAQVLSRDNGGKAII